MQLQVANSEDITLDLVNVDGVVYLTAETKDSLYTLLTLQLNEDNELEFSRRPGISHDNLRTDVVGRLTEVLDEYLDEDELYVDDEDEDSNGNGFFEDEDDEDLYVDDQAHGC